MKTIKISLPKTVTSARILPLADLHLGDINCDIVKIKEMIKFAVENDDVYIILNGDLINNATKTSVSDVYSETVKPMEQLKTAVELFEPVKNKILCITSGNHEARTYKNDGIDLTELLARELDVADRYAPESAVLFLSLGVSSHASPKADRQTCYSFYVSHGYGGGRKEGGKVNSLADVSSIVDVDCYIHSHKHLPVVFKESFFRTNPIKKTVALVDKLFVQTSSFLKYGGYGERYGFKPASTDTPIIYIDGLKKKMTARV